jgi:uncharacterized protein (TIRG00374 family)
MDVKRVLWFVVSVLIIGGLIYLVDINQFLEALSKAELSFVLVALFIGSLPFLVWAFTWFVTINQMGVALSYRETIPIFLGGNFLNTITPAGQFGGEPLMAYILGKQTKLPYEKAFAAVLSADIINVIPIFTFTMGGGLYLLTGAVPKNMIIQLFYLSVITGLIGSILAYILWFRSGTIENILIKTVKKISNKTGRGENLADKIETKLKSVEEAFSIIGEDPRKLILTGTVTHLAFLFNILALYIVMISLGLDPTFSKLVFILPLSSIATFSPTPGGSGTYEGVMALVLTNLLKISPPEAVATAILFRACTYGPALLLGYIGLHRIRGGIN